MTKRVRNTIASINGLLSAEQTEIMRTAALLILPTFLTKITGQVFNLIVAAFYGTSNSFSLFLVADALPQMIANVLLFGVVGAIVIPIFVEVKDKESKEYFLNFYSTVFNLAIIVFSFIAILVILLADKVMPFVLQYLIDPNEVPTAEELNLIIAMTRVLFIPQIILGASVFVSSGLNVYNRFLLPQLSPLFYNIGMLAGAILFIPLTDKSPWAIVFGVILGSIMHFLIPIPLARSLGLRLKFVLDLDSKYLLKLVKVTVPRLLAYSTEQFALMINKFITFGFSTTFISAQFFANSVINAIPSLFGLSFAIASYPTLSSLFHQEKYDQFNKIMHQTINQVLFLSIPFIVTLIILRLPVVRLVYGLLPGEFDRESTYMTAWLIMFLGFGVFSSTLRGFLYRVYYAAQNTRIPLIISMITMVISVGGTILFSNYFSHFNAYSISELYWEASFFLDKATGKAAVAGVGAGATIAGMVEMILLLVFFRMYIVKYDIGLLAKSIGKKLIAGFLMSVLMFAMYKLWEGLDALPVDAQPEFAGSTTINLIILTGITVTTSFMSYYLICIILGVEEIRLLRRFLNPVLKLGGIEIR